MFYLIDFIKLDPNDVKKKIKAYFSFKTSSPNPFNYDKIGEVTQFQYIHHLDTTNKDI